VSTDQAGAACSQAASGFHCQLALCATMSCCIAARVVSAGVKNSLTPSASVQLTSSSPAAPWCTPCVSPLSHTPALHALL